MKPNFLMTSHILSLLAGFLPPANAGDRFEQMRAALGALFGLVLTAIASYGLLGASGAAWLIAPMGASAVLLFCVPASPLAQPWSVMGGNLVAALIGITCARVVDDVALAAAIAGCLAIAAMFLLRCLHPPAGAVALTAVLGGPAVHAMGYRFALTPVALNSALMLLTALFYNNATGRRYPHRQSMAQPHLHKTADIMPTQRLGFTAEDLDAVLRDYNQVLDVSRDDLETLFLQTEMQAYRRRFGIISCADIMSRDGITVEFGTPLTEAWRLMQEHRVHALPVLDRSRRVIGIVTHSDFLRHSDPTSYSGLRDSLRRLLRASPLVHSEKPEVVGQIMARPVKTAPADLPVANLVPLMADLGLHHMPVVDEDGRLVGMVTQSDLVAALYERRLAGV
jgi:CBS domain-containing membrane protein